MFTDPESEVLSVIDVFKEIKSKQLTHQRTGYRAVLGLLALRLSDIKNRARVKAEYKTDIKYDRDDNQPSNLQRENAQSTLNFILCAFGTEDLQPIPPYLETVLLEWNEQFAGVCRILSIDMARPS